MMPRMRKFGLSLLNMKYLLFVPPLILWGILPLLAQMFGSATAADSDIMNRISDLVIGYVPLFSVWWHVFTLKDEIDSQSREIIYVYDMQYHTAFPETIARIILYLLCMIPCALLMGVRMSDPILQSAFRAAAALSVLYAACVYWLSYLLRSSYFALTAVILYYVLTTAIHVEKPVWSIYHHIKTVGADAMIPLMLALAAVLLLIGYLTDRFYYKPKL